MTVAEYFTWKRNNPDEWEEVRKDTIRNFLVEKFKANKHRDDIMFECPSINKDNRVYTYKRVLKALQNANDCCDELVRIHKQSLDYKKEQNIIKE